MNIPWKTIVWQQFGAAIDMLDNALRACPDELWRERGVVSNRNFEMATRTHLSTAHRRSRASGLCWAVFCLSAR